MSTELLRFDSTLERDPAIDAWMKNHAGELGAIAQQWFQVMRACGDEVRELLHDGCPSPAWAMCPSPTSTYSQRTSTSDSFKAHRCAIRPTCCRAPANSCAMSS